MSPQTFDEPNSTPVYRMIRRFAFYDSHRSHMFKEWAEGSVPDPADIEWLISLGAPLERIEAPEA